MTAAQVAIYTTPEGVAVLIPAPEFTAAEVAAKDAPEGADIEIIAAAALPPDRVFRAAWRKAGAAVAEDVSAARAIAHDRRRADRASKLAPLDIDATIQGKAAAAEAARQVIRDANAAMQTRIDAAPDVAALRAELATLP